MQYNTANSTFISHDKSIAEVVMLADASGSVYNPSSKTVSLSNTVTVNTTAYVVDNSLGGLITLPSAVRTNSSNSGIIQDVIVTCASNNQPVIDVVFFSANPANSTFVDHSNSVVANTDLPNIIGVAHVSDWTYLNGPNIGQATNLAIPFYLSNSNTLYAAMFIRSATTFLATTDIGFKVEVLQD